MMPIRVKLSRAAGWRMPPNTVKVDRTTPWGNPWMIPLDGDAAEVVRRFRATLMGFESNGSFCKPDVAPDSYLGKIIRDAHLLRGKNLACWCPLDKPCHADVLLALANEVPE